MGLVQSPPVKADRRTAEQLASIIVHEFHPAAIWLYGSVARGEAHEDSDIDLLVVMDFVGRAYRKAAEIRGHLPTSVPIDIRVISPQEFRDKLEEEWSFYMTVVEEGVQLHGS